MNERAIWTHELWPAAAAGGRSDGLRDGRMDEQSEKAPLCSSSSSSFARDD